MRSFATILFTCVFLLTTTHGYSGRKARKTAPPDRVKLELVFPPVELRVPSQQGLMEVPELNLVSDLVTVIGVGDIMMGTDYPNSSYLPPNDGRDLLSPLHTILQNATVTFGNLEGVLLDGEGSVKKCRNPELCYAFRSPERFSYNLADAGFDMVSLANNHTGDFGSEGREATVAALIRTGIAFAGTLDHQFTVIERRGVTFAMAAFSPNVGTVSIHDIDNAQRLVSQLQEVADIIIVSFHGGAEGPDHQNVKCETEFYYGENRGNVCNFARKVIDAGADIVFGHGPHVTRSVDLYRDRFIIYSLGNFCTYARFNLRGENGIAPLVKVYTNKQGEFLRAEVTPIRQIGRGEPITDFNHGAIKSLQRLLREDFPDSELVIHDNGLIERKEKILP
ncbi:MAG: CapA family protein [Bacteroidota bacterium]